MTNQTKLRYLLFVSTLIVALIAAAPCLASAKSQASLDPGTQFYVPKPNHGAIEQIADLTSDGKKAEANLIKKMIETPQAVWFTQGTPKTVQQDVRNTVQRAADKGQVPVLVAYNIPFRDCAQFSAGGATSVAELMHTARPVFLDLADRADLCEIAEDWQPRVDIHTAETDHRPADALLIRPDAHIAWAATIDEPTDTAALALREALSDWFSTPLKATVPVTDRPS